LKADTIVADEPPQKMLDRRHPELILPVARLKGTYKHWQWEIRLVAAMQ
jgi:hypothetical protein